MPKPDAPSITVLALEAVDTNASSVTDGFKPLARTERAEHFEAATIQTSAAIVSQACTGVNSSMPAQASQEVKLLPEAVQNSFQVDLAQTRARKGVRFDDAAITVHEIAPYAEIYGLHPRDFFFDKRYFLVPANGNEMVAGFRRESRDEDHDSDLEDSDSEWCIEYCI